MRPNLESVGPLVLALRRRLGVSQRAFAAQCGLEREHLSRIENGHNKASSHQVRQALARGAGVDVDALGRYFDGLLNVDGLVALRAQEAA